MKQDKDKKKVSDWSGTGFKAIKDILSGFEPDQDRFISREFQKYGYDLAQELGDLKNKSLYIKLAKEENRVFLEAARNFVKDATSVKNPAKLFMWKLTQLRREVKAKR